MARDMFLKIEGIDGESVDASHTGEIDINSFSWGMSQSGTTHVAKGGGGGKVNVSDMSFSKFLDKATPNLMLGCCLGTHYDSATLTCRKAGGTQIEYLIIVMTDVIISSISAGGSDGGDLVSESLSLNFAEFDVSYFPQEEDNTAGAEVKAGYKIAATEQK